MEILGKWRQPAEVAARSDIDEPEKARRRFAVKRDGKVMFGWEAITGAMLSTVLRLVPLPNRPCWDRLDMGEVSIHRDIAGDEYCVERVADTKETT